MTLANACKEVRYGYGYANVQSYRLISNLLIALKLLERITVKQLSYLEKSALLPQLHPTYRTVQSTETAVLSAVRYTSRYRLRQSVCASAIRFIRSLWHGGGGPPHFSSGLGALERSCGLNGLLCQKFQSYLVGNRQFVWTGSTSLPPAVPPAVPQGLVLDRSCYCCTQLLTCYCLYGVYIENSTSELFIPLSATFIWTCWFNLLHTAITFHHFFTVSVWAQNLPVQKILSSTLVCLSDWSHGSRPFTGLICWSVLCFSSIFFCFSYY